jgi:serine protease Do
MTTRNCLTTLALLLLGCTSAIAMSPAEMSELARRTTFEIVLPKVEPETVRYEKPLPLELLTFTERTDRYWSIGTAFAIAPDTYVSAAHVLLSAIGSPMGKPHLRDTEGNTYPVDQVLKFSLHEDYIVFRAKGAPARGTLTPNREVATGTTVYAVGNALGEGVVVRDGLLTSLTPEDQDGRWKWLRFSAAASPGNSGGPLLDSAGQVTGVIIAKSEGENLNYALPVARVLDGSSNSANMDVRSSFGVPILRQQLITTYKESFSLPASWENFSRKLIESNNRQFELNQRRLLEQQDAQLLPRGQSARLLATLDRSTDLALIQQQADDSWGLTDPEGVEETELSDGGTLWTGSLSNVYSFRLQRPVKAADASIYRDTTAFMDTLLKGLKIPRIVGPQAIRITSLGPAQRETRHVDRFGRIWQQRTWSLGYADMLIVTLSLPTPEGYSGLIRIATESGYQDAVNGLHLLSDYLHISYQGGLSQWRTLLAERELCPPMLRNIQLVNGKDYTLRLRDLDLKLPTSLLALDDESSLTLYSGYRSDGRQLHSDLAGLTLEVRPEDASWIGIWAQPRPASGAGSKLEERWKKMSNKEGDFTGQPQHSSDYKKFWTTSTFGDPARDLLYEVVLSWNEKSLLPRQVSERRDQVLTGLRSTAPVAR